MTHFVRSSLLIGALLLCVALPGCGDSENERGAKIQGTVPTDNLSTQQRRESARGSGDSVKSGMGGSAPAGTPKK